MKSLKLFSFLFVFVSTFLFVSCTRESVDYFSTARETISAGEWRVDYYFSGQDKTAQFRNYQFSFRGDGKLMATDGASSLNGAWNLVKDVNRNEELRISMEEPFLQDLNQKWTVTSTDAAKITLKAAGGEMHLRKL